MSGGDGMDSNTQVPIVKCVWVLVAMFHRVRHSMSLSLEDLAPVALPCIEKPPGVTVGGPSMFRVA
jgi:hypothetical protein